MWQSARLWSCAATLCQQPVKRGLLLPTGGAPQYTDDAGRTNRGTLELVRRDRRGLPLRHQSLLWRGNLPTRVRQRQRPAERCLRIGDRPPSRSRASVGRLMTAVAGGYQNIMVIITREGATFSECPDGGVATKTWRDR